MCGIAGFNSANELKIKQMTDKISHRGPDADGFFVDLMVSLGHRRLAILDLSEKGKQPMHYKHYSIVFNGEIYNYEEIREQLLAKGHLFVSNSDTEVLLHAYEEWGANLVEKMNGMWAFCIYDAQKKQLFLSRDRFGVKPLYYFWDNEQFIFASEIKAIRCHDLKLNLNVSAINYFFYQKYIGNGQTIFEKIYKLPPAHHLILELDSKKLTTFQYFDIKKEVEKARQIPLEKRLEMLPKLLEDAVLKRLISDVPVGSFLSGGVDSSLISALIAKHKPNFDTFSIGFKEKTFDELAHSKIVADHIHTQHHTEILDLNEDLIPFLVRNMDEPFGDSSIIPTYLLSKITRKKATVALSGDAADEIFGGYDVYKAAIFANYIPNFAINLGKNFANLIPASDKNLSLSFKIKKFLNDYHPNPQRRHLNWLSQSNENQRQHLLGKYWKSESDLISVSEEKDLTSIQLLDLQTYMLDDILTKVDSASMRCALEVRNPFLDYRVVPLALSLPDDLKIKGTETKFWLKKLAEKYVPKQVLYRKKQGFAVPMAKWIKESKLMKTYLNEEKYYVHGYLSASYVQNLYQEHLENKQDHSRILWLVFVFNYWIEQTNYAI